MLRSHHDDDNDNDDDEISTSPRGLGKYITLFNKEVVKT